MLAAVQPEKVVVPCCGSFSLAETARVVGVPGDKIVCGDISLYSTALGHAIMDKDWRLELKGEHGEIVEPYLCDPISKAAAVLFMIRLLQYEQRQGKVHHNDHYRELYVNADLYIGDLKAQIAVMAENLHGLEYHARDMWETLELYRNDPGAVILVNPPRYTGGYDRMFRGIDEVFDWDEPKASQFIERDYARLMDLLGESPALSMMYYATPIEDPAPLWGEPWRSVFADRPSNRRLVAINWIIANRSPITHQISRSRFTAGKAKYTMFGGEITEDSNLWAKREEKDVAGYYKDLFIHKLPGGLAERYAVLLLDGELLGVLGLHLAATRSGNSARGQKATEASANLIFAFTVPHDTYARLHKLTLMSLVSSWFWDDVFENDAFYQLAGYPPTLATTMLTPHPENKTARGILKMVSREKQGDGTYKLRYRADIIDRTREETLALWLGKYGTLTQ